MIRTLITTILTLTFARGGSAAPHASQPKPANQHQSMIATMDQFLRDPTAADPSVIMKFVRESPDVLVVYEQRLIPIGQGLSEDAEALLLVGFAAGSARGQLASGVKRASPVEGTRGMLAMYSFLKSKTAMSNQQLDDLAARSDAGTLEAAVAERLAP